MTSVAVECQILNQLECILAICDTGIHYKTPTTKNDIESVLWNIRLLAESTLHKQNFIIQNFSIQRV